MRKFIKASTFLLSPFLILTAFWGCVPRDLPMEEFQSLQELKDSFNDSRIIFPDLTGYEYDNTDTIYWKDYTGKSNIVEGYNIGGTLDAAKSKSNLWNLSFMCRLLETTYDKRNPEPPLNANTTVSGIDVYEKVIDTPNTNYPYLYPEGSRSISRCYTFDFNDCRYSVLGTLVITPEKLKALDDREINVLIKNCKNELLNFVKLIIGKE